MGWMNKHKSASDAELKHQTEMMVREREHLAELQRLEEEISRQRLATLTSLENAAKDEMDLMDKVRSCLGVICTTWACFCQNFPIQRLFSLLSIYDLCRRQGTRSSC